MEKNGEIEVIYKDNGKGLPDDFNIDELKSLGVILITQLTKQLDGTLEVKNDNGAEFIMRF